MAKRTFSFIVGIIAIVYAIVVLLIAPITSTAVTGIVFVILQAAFLVWAASSRPISNQKGLFLAYPRFVVPTLSWAVQIIAGAVFCAIAFDNVKVVIAIGIVLLAISAISTLTMPKAADFAMEVEKRIDNKTEFMSDFLLQLKALRTNVEAETELASKMDDLIEKVRFSDPASNQKCSEYEIQMKEIIDSMEHIDIETIQMLITVLEKRNQACKAGK